MFLADAAKAYPFLGSRDVAYRARSSQIVPDAFLTHCPAIDLTKYGSEHIITGTKITTSPHIQSMRINMQDMHMLFLELTEPPLLPGLTSLCLNRGSSQDLWILEDLPQLRHLKLYNTDLSTPLNPKHFEGLMHLERLEMYPMDFQYHTHFLHGDLVETLASLPLLRKIKFGLNGHPYEVSMPTNLGKLSSLTHFACQGVRDNEALDFLKTLTKLRSLNIRKCDTSSLEPLWDLPHLTSIKAKGTQVDPATVAGLKHVRYLKLNECGEFGIQSDEESYWQPNRLAYFGGLTSLRALDLRETFSDHPIDKEWQVAVLARLNLLYLGLTDSDIAPAARPFFDELGVRYSADDMPKTVKRAIKHMDAQDDAPAA